MKTINEVGETDSKLRLIRVTDFMDRLNIIHCIF